MEGIVKIFTRLQSTGHCQLVEADEDSICFQINVFVDRLLHDGKIAQADWIWNKTLELSGLEWRNKVDAGIAKVGGGSLLMNYGTYLASRCRYMDAITVFDQVIATYPRLKIKAIDNKENAKNYVLDRWHYRMLNDKPRNTSYFKAIEWAICRIRSTSQMEHIHVLDIGGGTGLLSMYAVQLGAKHVYCVEMNAELAKVAQKCVNHNGMGDKITIISKHSKDVSISHDIPCKVSLIVTELVDSGIYLSCIYFLITFSNPCLLLKCKPESLNNSTLCHICEEN